MSKPLISRFDDTRILHASELLLELRVRIQSSHPSLKTGDPLCRIQSSSVKGTDQVSFVEEQTEKDNNDMSWTSISVPTESGSTSELATVGSPNLALNSPSTLITDETDSSWAEI